MMQSKKSKSKLKLNFPAIGTSWQIDILDSKRKNLFAKIESEIYTLVEEFDKNYSRFRADSWITHISKKPGTYKAPPDFPKLFNFYLQLFKASNGLFTPLIGQTLVDAGYDSSYTLMPKKTLTKPDNLTDVVNFENNSITLKKPSLLDFGAAGKGYLIDKIGNLLRQNEISAFCIDGSGDLLYESTYEAVRVGLEHPLDPTLAIGVCNLQNQSICGSAGNRRAWGKFHHTINPKTLMSPTSILATWIVADTALLADGLATCLYLDDRIEQYSNFKFEYVIMYRDSSLRRSPNFPGEFFTV